MLLVALVSVLSNYSTYSEDSLGFEDALEESVEIIKKYIYIKNYVRKYNQCKKTKERTSCYAFNGLRRFLLINFYLEAATSAIGIARMGSRKNSLSSKKSVVSTVLILCVQEVVTQFI